MFESLDFFHANLFNPFQAVPAMKLLYLQLQNRFGPETAYHSWAADVKEMYDWLPQQDIIKAIDWVLKHVQRKSRRSHVTVTYIKKPEKADLESLTTLMLQYQYHSNRFLKCLVFNLKMPFFS